MCDVSPDEESSMTCSRVRPVNKVRRRRIIDTYGLHHRLPKAAKVRKKQIFSAVLRICTDPDSQIPSIRILLSLRKNSKKAMILTVLYDFFIFEK